MLCVPLIWTLRITLQGSSGFQGNVSLPENFICSPRAHLLCCQLFSVIITFSLQSGSTQEWLSPGREVNSCHESRFFPCCHCSSESVLWLVLPWAVSYLVHLISYSCLTSPSLALACWCSFTSWQSAVLRVPGYHWLSSFPIPVASASLWLITFLTLLLPGTCSNSCPFLSGPHSSTLPVSTYNLESIDFE